MGSLPRCFFYSAIFMNVDGPDTLFVLILKLDSDDFKRVGGI
jgi:hypothetical protein